MKFTIRVFINAFFLLLAPFLFNGIAISSLWSAIMTALFLGILNAIIRPVLIILTLPINFLTLGLFTLIINGLLVLFVASFVKGFFVANLWSAIILSLFLCLGSLLSNYLLKD